MPLPLITIAVPSFNQGRFLDEALTSIFRQELPVEVFVMDGGSSDNTREVIARWEPHLARWPSHPDHGQAAAINEGIALGQAPYVCRLNSDDMFLPGGLAKMVNELEKQPVSPAVYGRSWNLDEKSGRRRPVRIEPFNQDSLARRCIISQPATLIRRSAWEKVGGVNPLLQMTMDYDLWWRLYRQIGPLYFIDEFIAVNREHEATKTRTRRRDHYREAIATVRHHYGRVPIKWWLAQPYAVWLKSLLA